MTTGTVIIKVYHCIKRVGKRKQAIYNALVFILLYTPRLLFFNVKFCNRGFELNTSAGIRGQLPMND
jgi:hypothetical protein